MSKVEGFFSLSADRDRKISPSEWQLSLPSCLPLFLEMQLPTSVTDVVSPLLVLQPDPGAGAPPPFISPALLPPKSK